MSKYTTEVRYICETNTSHPITGDGFNNVEEIINSSHVNIFNFDYPIFDNRYRAVLEKKILRHFYTREICDETVGLWKLRMCDRLNVIMPYYNQLYESALLEFNPFYDTDYTRTGNVKDDKLSVDSENEISNKILANDVDKSSNSMKTSKMSTEKSKSGEQNGSNSSDVESTTDNTSTSKVTTNKNDTYTSTVTSNKNDTYSASGTTNKNDTITGTTTNTETKTNSSSGNSTDKYSDTPQGSISNLANDTYLTNARMINKSDSSSDNLQGSVTKNEVNSETGEVSNSGNNKTKYDSDTKDKNNTEYESNTSDTNNTTYESHINGTDSKNIRENESVESKDIDNEINKVKESGNASENYNKKGNRSGSVKNLNEYAEKVIGKMGGASYSKMLNEFRSTFLNIDAMILKDLEPLFFGLW